MLRAGAYACVVLAFTASLVAAPARAVAPGRTATQPTTQSIGRGVSLVRPLSLSAVSSSLGWRLPRYVNDKRLAGLLAYEVVDAESGQLISARHAYLPVMPASTFKILTAVVALRVIGPNARSSTDVVELPAISALPNVTRVALVGGGDSLLSTKDLTTLLDPVIEHAQNDGNTSIQLSIDDSMFPSPTNAYGWLSKYLPGVISPVRALERDGRHGWDTSADVGRWFTTQLRARGMKATYAGRRTAPVDALTVASFKGHTTKESVRKMLLFSDNDVAEHLARLSAMAGGEEPTYEGWRSVAVDELKSLGMNLTGLHLYDGSGLSRQDRLTPAALITLLRVAMKSSKYPSLSSMLVDQPASIPLAGRTGTLKNRFTSAASKCARGRVFAKTGFLTGTGSLAGVAKGVDGRTRLFAIVLNNQSKKVSDVAARAALDEMAATITGCTFAR